MMDKCGGTTMAVGEEKTKALHDDVFASSSSSSSGPDHVTMIDADEMGCVL